MHNVVSINTNSNEFRSNKIKPNLKFIQLFINNENIYKVTVNSTCKLKGDNIDFYIEYRELTSKPGSAKVFDDGVVFFMKANQEVRLQEVISIKPSIYSNGYVVFDDYKNAILNCQVLLGNYIDGDRNINNDVNDDIKSNNVESSYSLPLLKPQQIEEILSKPVKSLIHMNSFILAEETNRVKKNSLRKLLNINDKLIPSEPPVNQIQEAFKHFLSKDYKYFDSKRKAKALSFSILNERDYSAIHSRSCFSEFTSILYEYPSKVIGYNLLFAMMLYWNDTFTQNKLIKFSKKYFEYNNFNTNSFLFKPAKFIFDPAELEELIHNFCLSEAYLDSYFNDRGLKQSIINTSFFTSVIKRIVIVLISDLNNKNPEIDKLKSICQLYENGYFSKSLQILFISRIIITTNKENLPSEEIRHFALNNIGDVDHPNWRLSNGLSKNEVSIISGARSILESWMTELFLERFWTLIEDKMRRKFWKKYSSKMSNVKIILDDVLYNRLDEQIKNKPYLSRIYCGSSGAVLIFEINERMFVEFGGYAAGPLQVYRNNNVITEIQKSLNDSVRSKRYPKRYYTNHLKRFTTFENLMDRGTIIRDNGRFAHQGNWYSRLTKWMNKYA